jgi:hypothetical protein
MSAPDLGGWEPLSVSATCGAFSPASFRWWFTGGQALELHLGRSWRDHEDTDVSIIRRDVVLLRPVLAGWDIYVAAAGRLTPWSGEELNATLHQNNLWCRRRGKGAWLLDVSISEGDDDAWIYRHDESVRFPWVEAVLQTPDGVAYLAPELQLLFKSRHLRRKDDVDASEVIPELSVGRRAQLTRLLPAEHAWQGLLAEQM